MPPCGCWEWDSGPPQEQVLLITEPSLQPHDFCLKFTFFWKYKVTFYISGWPQILHPPASVWLVLEWQVWTSTLVQRDFFFKDHIWTYNTYMWWSSKYIECYPVKIDTFLPLQPPGLLGVSSCDQRVTQRYLCSANRQTTRILTLSSCHISGEVPSWTLALDFPQLQ